MLDRDRRQWPAHILAIQSFVVLFGASACQSSKPPLQDIKIGRPAAGTLKERSFVLRGECTEGHDVRVSGSVEGSPKSPCRTDGSFSVLLTLTDGEGDKQIRVTQRDGDKERSDQRDYKFRRPIHREVDLFKTSVFEPGLRRIYGGGASGTFGVPVAGGSDVDGDGHVDYAHASMLAGPHGRKQAGLVWLSFGNGSITGLEHAPGRGGAVLEIWGRAAFDSAGSEIWMDDVTGDGLGDILIAEQNHSPDETRVGAGALSIVVGNARLKAMAINGMPFDLQNPPMDVPVIHIIGGQEFGRLGIWMRTGDVNGDGVKDIGLGADQESENSERHRGAVYLIQGGDWLLNEQVIDLASFGTAAWAERIARVLPPNGAVDAHLGATVQLADLDNNGRAEVLVAATLNRMGAALEAGEMPSQSSHSSGGLPTGVLFIAWDDNFPSMWTAGMTIRLDQTPGASTRVEGRSASGNFGEEIIGGDDFDNDGHADLFVGDLTANFLSRPISGSGHLFYEARLLRNQDFRISSIPKEIHSSIIYGATARDLAADTAAAADFDGDGIVDLALCSPHADPLDRSNAGQVHVLFGRNHRWPEEIDLASLPSPESVRITSVLGAHGDVDGNGGDTLCYSAAAADINKDGKGDLITNEMVGDSLFETDVGNLILLDGVLLSEETSEPACQTDWTLLAGQENQPCTFEGRCDQGLSCDTKADLCVQPEKLPDCRSPEQSCAPPHTCVEANDKWSCTIPMDTPPTCTAPPGGQDAQYYNVVEQSGGRVQHWAFVQGCIPVSYDPCLADRAEEIRSAVRDWNQVSCSDLCLADPVEMKEKPSLRRVEPRIHFLLGRPDIDTTASVINTFGLETARILNAVVVVRLDHHTKVAENDFLTAIGWSLGMGVLPKGSNSIFAQSDEEAPKPATILPADEAAFCALYGSPRHCGE